MTASPPAPKDFTEVSPESIGVRVKLEAALDFLKSLKGQDVEVGLSSLAVSCDALRAGEQTINLTVDPDRAAALIAKAKSMPGVVAAGWTSGIVDMDRTIRFPAADWRDGDKINKDKLASAISSVLAKTLAAKPAPAAWNANTGKLKLTFKRPSQIYPALELTETIEITALVSPDKPGGSDRLMLWIGKPAITTADDGAGPKLNLSEEFQRRRGRRQPKDDNGSVEALAKEFKGQRWDADKSGGSSRASRSASDCVLMPETAASSAPTNETKSPCRFQVAGLGQRRDQIIVGLRPGRRAVAVLHRAGDEDHGVARHRKLALAALAPEFERRPRHCRRFRGSVFASIPADGAASSVISIPNGKPSSARAGPRGRRQAANSASATAACLQMRH